MTDLSIGVLLGCLAVLAWQELRAVLAHRRNPPKLYRHKRTRAIYKELARGTDSETEVDVVVYQHIASKRVWVRPAVMFDDGRFEPFEAGRN